MSYSLNSTKPRYYCILPRCVSLPKLQRLRRGYHNLLQLVTIALIAFLSTPESLGQEESYPDHPDALSQVGAPRGDIKGPFKWYSKIYPGTERDYWLYVPKQYAEDKPACVFVLQDGLQRAKGWQLVTTMDNLIHKKEMPVTIGVFIDPGVAPAPHEGATARYNRSFEYDALGDRYARFLMEEILPEVSQRYNLSKNPNDRAIGGASSGAICAFNVAWEKPNEFRRVLSTIGTYVGLRGGEEFPTLVRKCEPKPIRVFLQDGSNDLNIFAGDWWTANLSMLSALKFAGYDVNHAWGDGGHSSQHAAAIMPDVMRWLWRDHPQPVVPGKTSERRIDLVIPGEDWQLVSEGHQFTEGPASNKNGEVFFTDIPNGRIHKIGLDGNVSVFVEKSPAVNGLMFGPDGQLYACQNGTKRIVRYDKLGRETVVLNDASANDVLILPEGGYYTDPNNKKVWHFTFEGQRKIVDEGIAFPNGIVASPDHSLLTVSDTHGRFTFSYRIQADGSLAHKQSYGYLHLQNDQLHSGADGMTVDKEGRIYVTTRLGIQVLDQPGRVHLILSKPQDGWVSNAVFGGPEMDTLFVTCQDKVYRRRVNAKGFHSWEPPRTVGKPRL